MILYILLALIFLYLFISAYIKLKYGFWASQPVFHVYDFRYMICPPGIISHQLPTASNKYINFQQITTSLFNELTSLQTQRFVDFVKRNYLQNDDNVYIPEKHNITPYFTSHNDKSFASFYEKDDPLIDLKKGTTIENRTLVGIITSRPIQVTILGNTFPAYYVDYLCVNKNQRKKGIAQELIQTHHYNQSHLNKNIVVSLFKREDELTAIVPLCVYSTFGFSVKKWEKPASMHAQYKFMNITSQNYHVLTDFILHQQRQFEVMIHADFANILELIKTKNMFVSVIMVGHDVQFAYFFRKTCTFVKKGLEVLSCFATINGVPELKDVFIQGFKTSFWKTAEENNFGFAAVENISHNDIIIQNLRLKTAPLIISPTAYFFYNFAYKTFPANQVLLIN